MFIFDGIDFSEKIKVTKVTRPILAPQSLSTTTIEGRTGSKFHRKTSSSYTITVDFFLKEKVNMRDELRELAYLLDTEKPAKLIFKDEPDKFINAIVSGNTDFEPIFRNGNGVINFYCADPHWYAVNDDIFDVKVNTEYVFNRQGSAVSYPIYEISGSGNGKYSITTNGKTMIATCNVGSGEKLVIDSEKLTAYILQTNGTKKSILMYLDNLDFPVLNPKQNKVTIKGTDGATVTSYRINCKSKWK